MRNLKALAKHASHEFRLDAALVSLSVGWHHCFQPRLDTHINCCSLPFLCHRQPEHELTQFLCIWQLNVAYLDAILGAQYKVDTIHGTAWLKIPPGTQHGASLKLKGAGVEPSADDSSVTPPSGSFVAGSHYFQVAVKVPIQVDASEAEVLRQLRKLDSQ